MEGQSTSLKPSRKPAFVPGLGWGFKPRQSVEKGFGNRSVSKLTLGFQALFQFAAQTRSAQPNGLPLGWVARYCRRFSAEKRAGKGMTPLRDTSLVSPQRNGALPRTLPSNSVAGRSRQRDRARETAQKKRAGIGGKVYFHNRFPTLFFVYLPQLSRRQNAGFRGELERRLLSSKAVLSNVLS